MRRGFSLIELLVTLAVVAVLVGVLMPTLARARDASRATVCLANLRSMAVIFRAYADDHRGFSPALGQPYAAPPNWALVVQQATGREGSTAGELLHEGSSVLVCPSVRAMLGTRMQRTYAANATGHAGLPGDRGDYDAPPPGPWAHARLDLITEPRATVLLVDSTLPPPTPDAPPSTRTSSVIDFRQPAHRAQRLGLPHPGGGGRQPQAALADGSAAPQSVTVTSAATAASEPGVGTGASTGLRVEVPAGWLRALP